MPGLFNPSGNTKKKEDEENPRGGLFNPSSSASSTTTKTGGGGLFKPSSSSSIPDSLKSLADLENPFDTAATERSIANAKLRIQASGWPVDEDKRNPVEKALNLPEGQNWFFDTLDVLNRPQQALFGGMDAIIKTANGTPTNRDQAFLAGLTGKQKVHGSDLLEGIGVKNKALKSTLGFVADVAADPLNVVPAKWIDRVADLTGAAAKKGLNAVESVAPPVRTLRETKIQPALQTGKDALGRIFVPKYKWDETLSGTRDPFLKDRFVQTENDIRYMTEEALKGVTDAARKSGGLDTGTDVGRIMEKDLRQFEEVKGFEFPDGVRRTENKQDLLDEIAKNKTAIKDMGKVLGSTTNQLSRNISQTAQELEKVDRQIRSQYFSKENTALRQLTKRKNQPTNIDELAKSKAMSQVSVSPAFNYLLQRRDELKTSLDSMRSDLAKTKATGTAQIESIVNANNLIREAAKNPVAIQKELPRPQRDLSTDSKVTAAAETLVKSNNAIRDWAISNDIPVGEIEGYMRHILSAEEQAARKLVKPGSIDRSPTSMNNPSKSILKNRELMGSVEDINERIGRKFFEPNAFFASAIGQKKLIEYGNAVKFRREVLSNPSFAQKYVPGQTPAPVNGQVVINTNNYKFLTNPNNVALADNIGGEYLVTSGVKQALDRYQKLSTDEGVNAFIKAYDFLTSGWKKLTLLSPEYHIRNDLGAKFNNYVGGMDPVAITKYTTSATKDVANALARGKETPLYNEFRRQGLGANSQLAIEFARHGNDAEKALRSVVKDQSRTNLQKGLGVANPLRIFKTSQELGSAIDQINRFALYKWAREAKRMTPEQAAAKVKEVQFDYTDLTTVEREAFARIIPFYRWSRNNIPFQLKRLATNPMKYQNVNKLKNEAQNYFGMDAENEQDYTKNNFALPISGDGQGSGYMLGLNLPLADLTKLTDPFKLASDSISPFVKLPFEMSSNRNLFNGKELEQFAGQQKKYQIPEEILGINVPGGGTPLGGIPTKTAHAIEQLGGQPARRLSNLFGVDTAQDKENAALNPVFGISSIFKKYDINETNFYDKKRELRELMDLIDLIEQETGTRPKSVTDIKKGL